MTKPTIKNLQKATKDISYSQAPHEKMESLNKAFEMFSQETSRLELSYQSLKEQFRELNLELEETNRQLKSKVFELDLITYYLKSILSNMSQGILFIDLHGMITTYNQAAEKILGISKSNVLFSSFWTHFKDDAFGFSLREAIKTNQFPKTAFASYQSPQGDRYALEVDITCVSKTEKIPPHEEFLIATQGLIILLRDMTEIHRLQGIANRNDRLKELGEMAAQVAHEIRNPLGGIKGFASLLERDLKDHPKLQKLAAYIVEGTNNLNRLVSQVLHYARPLDLHLENTDLAVLFNELKQLLLADERMEQKKIVISLKNPPKLMISIDPQQIKSALLNLLVNSLEAMPNGGTLTISAESYEEGVIIKVTDTGIGIPKDHLEKIFSPFFTTKAAGNGLGLAEVYKVIQAHEGTIECQSVIEQGTTFTVKLPLKKRY